MNDKFLIDRDGIRLAGSISGEGAELLFLHGLNASASMQAGNAPHGYRLASYDQRGHTDSTGRTDQAAYAIDEFVADAIAVLDHLGWRRPILAGTSMGAAVGTRLALDHPDRIRALALAVPAFGDTPNTEIARFDAIADAIDKLGMDAAIPLFQQGQQSRGIPAEATAWLDGWRIHDGAALAAANRVVGRWTIPDLERLASLPFPVVVACWPGDAMHPEALARRIAALTGNHIAVLPSFAEGVTHPELIGQALAPLLAAALKK